MRQGIYPAGCTCPTRHCPHCSTKGRHVKPDGFAADLHRKPEVLRRLAATLAAGNPWAEVVPPDVERVVLLGMGSSAYAGGVAAARMRARGLVASSELASSQLLPGWGAGTLVVATSASGGSVETLDALGRLPGRGAHGRADEHCGLGDHAAVRRRRRPGGRARGRRGGLPQLPAHAGPADGARMPPRGRGHGGAGGSRSRRRPTRAHTCSTPSPTGAQRFPSCCSARRAPTSPHRRTGSVRRSRAR